jgi:hypothetical protein
VQGIGAVLHATFSGRRAAPGAAQNVEDLVFELVFPRFRGTMSCESLEGYGARLDIPRQGAIMLARSERPEGPRA